MEIATRLLRLLRENSRQSLRKIAQKMNVPKSTVFDAYGKLSNLRFIVLLDIAYLDMLFSQSWICVLRVCREDRRECIHPAYVNTEMRLHGGHIFQELFLPSSQYPIIRKLEPHEKLFIVSEAVKKEEATAI